MAAPNGVNTANAPPPYGMGGPIIPNAGLHNDSQHIWLLVQELSAELQRSREQQADLCASANALRLQQGQNGQRSGENGHQANGEDGAVQSPAQALEALSKQLADTEKRNEDLEYAYQDLTKTLDKVMDYVGQAKQSLQTYATEHQQAIIGMPIITL